MTGFTAEAWDKVEVFAGRVATPEDVTAERAVFALADTERPQPMDEPLPSPAIWYEDADEGEGAEDGAEGQAVVIVQAELHETETGEELQVLGLLFPDGRTAVGFMEDVDLVDAADPVWRDLVEDALFAPPPRAFQAAGG